MPNNQQQPDIADDFSEFDFDENDVLVKDGEQEKNKSINQEIKKSRKPESKVEVGLGNALVAGKLVDLSKQPASSPDAFGIKQQLGAPLDLKKVQMPSEEMGDIQEGLVKQASMQKDKMEALGSEGEGLVYGEKDEEEIEKFKKNPLAKSSFNIDLLIRTLMSRLSIVSTLKIDLINRLKNIISSFLRDVRTSRATEELLQRSVESGGLNLSPEHSEQIMDFIKDEYKRIHSSAFAMKEKDTEVTKEKKEENKDDVVEPMKLIKPPKEGVKPIKLIESPKEEMEAISKKTAREAQVGVFSDEIANSYKKNSLKKKIDVSGKKDLAQWEKDLAIPNNLRTPEIAAPMGVKKLVAGTNAIEDTKVELSKMVGQKELTKSGLVFKDFRREEVLESLNEALAQDENKVQNLEKKKVSWFSKMFKQKQEKSIKSKVHKVESQKSLGQEIKKPINQDSKKIKKQEIKKFIKKEDIEPKVKDVSVSAPQALNLEKKEAPRLQPIVRRVVQDKPNFDNRRKMEDVRVVHPHLVGPIEELSEMTLVDFRRLGSTTQDSVDKIKEKIELSAKEFFNQKIVAINAWRKSQPNQFYIELGRQSLFKKLPVEDLINQYNLENKPTLTKQEFDLISQLNKELRY